MTKSSNRRGLLRFLALSPLISAVVPAGLRAQAHEAGLIGTDVCMLTAAATEGPFYTDHGLIRSDVTEDRPGLALTLSLQVVTADCLPVAAARVDIWHCDASGNYSGVAQQGSDSGSDTSQQTFLRGTQFTGPDGVAGFQTIYPGWYRGRTIHIHFKVFLPGTDQAEVLTGQIFFDDATSSSIFAANPPYADRVASRDTLNDDDRIALQAGAGSYGTLRVENGSASAAMVIGIDPRSASGGSVPGWFL